MAVHRDFNAPLPRPADSSAAMVSANALLLLSKLDTDALLAERWSQAAIEVVLSYTVLSLILTSALSIKIIHHTVALAWNPSWQSLLSNGTVNKPANNSLTGTVYGEYSSVAFLDDESF